MKFDKDEIDALKARHSIAALFEQLGFRVRGRPGWTLCPFHVEKTASCKVDDRRGDFRCFGCGADGDHIDILMHVRGMTFPQAVEALGGTRPVTPVEKKQIDERRALIEREDVEERERQRTMIRKMWEASQDIRGTHGEAYLAARYIPFRDEFATDLRFIPLLRYHGFLDENTNETTELGRYPAIIALIRKPQREHVGEVIGLHRTFLDPIEPRKLVPPGDTARNKAKKVYGEQRGGVIWLTEPRASMAMGEGIETTWAWWLLGRGAPDCGLMTGISLSNMSGRATGSASHPFQPARRIPNGIPDLEFPGIVLPDTVQEVTLLGDGDSDPPSTRAKLMCCGKRFEHQGKAVFVDMAPDGIDFADQRASEMRGGDAA